jgi:hypothetical protein
MNNLIHLDEWLSNPATRERVEHIAKQRDYYNGDHDRQVIVKPNQRNYNMTVNYTGLIIERGVSMLLGEGIEFDLEGEDETPEQALINETWDANKKDILLHKQAQFGGISGTCYVKLQPDGVESRMSDNKLLVRIIPLDPLYMRIETDPEDIDTVIRYVMEFTIQDPVSGDKMQRRETTERNRLPTEQDGEVVRFEDNGWTIINEKKDSSTHWKWKPMGADEFWEYEFPPILHWQNLPLAGSVYGKPDVTDDMIELQDGINFNTANIQKIIDLHAHPKTWATGFTLPTVNASWGVDEMVTTPSDMAKFGNLEMQSDLTSSQQFLLSLRQSMFDIGRTVDITSLSDKLGALTNFGLRVLFFDALAKLGSKRELYSEALAEINHRILVLAGAKNTDGGTVVWPEALPVSETEEAQADQFDLQNGIASKQTIAAKRGYDWELEQERMGDEQAQGDNIGALILKNFNNGGV